VSIGGIQEGESFWNWGDGGNFKSYVTASLSQKDAVVFFANGSNGLFFTKEILADAIGGEHPAEAYVDYPRYDSPSWLMRNDSLSIAVFRLIHGF
jgi:hypothetical protein